MFCIVRCGTVTAKKQNITGIKGDDVSVTFIANPAQNEKIVLLKIYILPDATKGVAYISNSGIFIIGAVPDKLKNRIDVAHIQDTNEYTLIISNVTYDDRSTEFFCKVVFEPFNRASGQTATSLLSEVKGMYCFIY